MTRLARAEAERVLADAEQQVAELQQRIQTLKQAEAELAHRVGDRVRAEV